MTALFVKRFRKLPIGRKMSSVEFTPPRAVRSESPAADLSDDAHPFEDQTVFTVDLSAMDHDEGMNLKRKIMLLISETEANIQLKNDLESVMIALKNLCTEFNPEVAKALVGVFDGTKTDEEATTMMQRLTIQETVLARSVLRGGTAVQTSHGPNMSKLITSLGLRMEALDSYNTRSYAKVYVPSTTPEHARQFSEAARVVSSSEKAKRQSALTPSVDGSP